MSFKKIIPAALIALLAVGYTVAQIGGGGIGIGQGPTFTNITGSTQCLHANSVGTISGTGADCGSSSASGANPTGTVGLSAVNGSAATFLRSDGAPALSQAITPTWTALHKYTLGDFALLGSSTGYTLLESGLSGASNNTLLLPVTASDTLAALGTAQTWTALQTITNSDLALLGSSTGKTTFTSANASATNYTVTVPAVTDTLVTQTQIPFIQWTWGIAVGVPPSGFFANNGVYVAGQVPSSSATCLTDSVANGTTHITCSAATLLGTSADVGRVFTINDSGTYRYVTLTTQNTTTEAAGTISNGSLPASVATISGVAITGTAGQFSCTCTGFVVGQGLTLSGTYGGTGSITGYSNPTTYYVSATNGTSTFTLQSAPGSAIVTTAGTPTGITYTPAGSATLANANVYLSGSPTTNTTAFSVPLPTTFANAYMFFPANAIVAGSSAGLYYAVCASTTVCTLYNNTLASGRPTIPGSPTAFSTTGPGAFTQTFNSSITLLTLSIPGGTMGAQGSIDWKIGGVRNNNADTVNVQAFYGASAVSVTSVSSVLWYPQVRTLRNAGVTNSQVVYPTGNGATSDYLSIAAAPTYVAIDSTSAQNFLVKANLVTAATDWYFTLGGTITTTYAP